MNNTISCCVYRASRKAETYVYLRENETEEILPEELRRLVGHLDLVMKLELHSGRTLAREDVNKVMGNLRERGWHLQLPPPPEILRISRTS